jgi:hypothetical protein
MAAPSLARRTSGVPEAAAGSSVPHIRDPSVSVARTSGPAGAACGANHSSPTVTTSAPSAPAAARTPFLKYPA